MKPLVDVLILSYNQINYIEACIESVLQQKYKEIHLIIADDCSTDGSVELIKNYQKKYPSVITASLNKKNLGITKNHNCGFQLRKGKYFCVMGGDDLMKEEKISDQVELMEKDQSISVCYHDMEVLSEKDNRITHLFSDFNPPRNGDISTAIKYGTFNCASSTMVRNSSTPEEGFKEEIEIASDWLFWVECLSDGGKIKYINKPLGIYRRHDNNITNTGYSFDIKTIDHLNSCNFLLLKHPELMHEIEYARARILKSSRFSLPYLLIVKLMIFNGHFLRGLAGFLIYVFSFGRLKL